MQANTVLHPKTVVAKHTWINISRTPSPLTPPHEGKRATEQVEEVQLELLVLTRPRARVETFTWGARNLNELTARMATH